MTTLLNLLARIEQADSGELLWESSGWCDRPATRTEVATVHLFLGGIPGIYLV